MERNGDRGVLPLHTALLGDIDQMLAVFDQAAQEIIDVGRPEGYFDAWDPAELRWPPTPRNPGPADLAVLEHQARLVTAIFAGVPARRDNRLAEAHAELARLTPAYHEATRIYLELKREFLARGAGSAQDFLQLYQSLYLDTLAKGDLFVPDAGEAALERARITRAPLSHAQASAEGLAAAAAGAATDDPRSTARYTATVGGPAREAALADHLRGVAARTLDYIAAGELLSTRYNTYNNLAWFGSSVWKVIVDAQLLLHRLGQLAAPRLAPAELELVQLAIHKNQAMLIEFFQAHREDPGTLRPASYWYGHQYSYLTRDMIDSTFALVEIANAQVRRAGAGEVGEVAVPPLLAGRVRGRFLEYPHVGRSGELPDWRRYPKLARWVVHSLRIGLAKRRLARAGLDEEQRLELVWHENLEWAGRTLRTFGIEVKVRVDPEFFPIARALELANGKRNLLFLPTHQSVFDHPVMYEALKSPELLAAMGWPKPVPCAMFARAGLSMAGVRIGSKSITMFGVSARTFDRLLEEVDGYVVADRTGDARNAVQRFARILERRPGVLYPALTTAAFAIQSPPLQHSLFAFLPQDVVIVPVALRGSHAVWPKCPKGNLRINPGLVEVMVAPPMLGEITLLPRRRSLRIQVEAAALFQAVHLTTLLNPEPSDS